MIALYISATDAEKRIAEAQARGDEARAVAAKATERAAAAELRLVQLRKEVEPRKLNGVPKQAFVRALATDGGHSVIIISAALDREAQDFADDFVVPFTDGHWLPQQIKNWVRPEYGISIGKVGDETLPGERTLASALSAAGLEYRTKKESPNCRYM